jgi:RNA polymerase sigma factor (sigma-70 family)
MGGEPSVRARRRQHARIHDRMTVLVLAEQSTEMIDSGAGQVDERAVEPSPIDTLIGAAVAGDAGARDRLLAEVHPLVLGYCRRRLGHEETVLGSAGDVAQEVCIAVVNALSRYTVKGLSFRSFVYGIAANKVTDAFRAMGRNRTEARADLPGSPVLHDGPEQRLLAAELAERLHGLVHLLTPRQRDVVILRIAAQRGGDSPSTGLHPRRRASHPAPRPQSPPRLDLPTGRRQRHNQRRPPRSGCSCSPVATAPGCQSGSITPSRAAASAMSWTLAVIIHAARMEI